MVTFLNISSWHCVILNQTQNMVSKTVVVFLPVRWSNSFCSSWSSTTYFSLKLSDKGKKIFQPRISFIFLPMKVVHKERKNKEQFVYSLCTKNLLSISYHVWGSIQKRNYRMITTGFSLQVHNLMDNTYLFNTLCVLDIRLGTKNTVVTEMQIPALMELTFTLMRQTVNDWMQKVIKFIISEEGD